MAEETSCPCCGQTVGIPPLDIVIARSGLRPMEASILRAIWRGNGYPVRTERIFDVMYEEDPDGGPSPTRMYLAFKTALRNLRARLKGVEIAIESVGYRRGYRLVIGGANESP